MANISIYLNGQQTAASLQWEDITVAAQWREGSASAIAEIENADFVKDSARIIADWINQGKIFNKLPIQIFATNATSTKSVFQGYLDLRESCVFSPNLEKISCSIKKNDDIADIADRADALLWSDIKGFFPAGRDVLACIDKNDSAIEKVLLGISIYASIKELQEAIKESGYLIADLSNAATDILFNPGAFIMVLAKSLIRAAYITAMAYQIFVLIDSAVKSLYPPQYKIKVGTLHDYLTAVFKSLGYSFQTSISELSSVGVLLPADAEDNFFNDIVERTWSKENKPYPTGTNQDVIFPSWALDMGRTMFNARFALKDGKAVMHPRWHSYWSSQSSWVIPAHEPASWKYNTKDVLAANTLRYATDSANQYTVIDYAKTSAQESAYAGKDSLIRGINRVAIPASLAPRYNERGAVEQLIFSMLETIGEVLSFFGIEIDLSFADNIGCVRLSQKTITEPTVFYMNGNRVAQNSKDIIGAGALWQKYHAPSVGARLENQSKEFENVTVPFGLDDFMDVLDSSRAMTSGGEDAELTDLKWNFAKDKAEVSYKTRYIYAPNIQITQTTT